MIQFICHPALEFFLTTDLGQGSLALFESNVLICSEYHPLHSPSVYAGIRLATYHRLKNPSIYIFLTSFLSKESLLMQDPYGILALSGTEFVRLPISREQFIFLIKEKNNTQLIISQIKWNEFALKSCKIFLKEKISVLKHGNKLDLVNNMTGALRIEAQNCILYHNRIPELRKLLANIKSFCNRDEIIEVIELSKIGDGLNDEFLQNISCFFKILSQLEQLSVEKHINFRQLILDIDELNTTSSRILNYDGTKSTNGSFY